MKDSRRIWKWRQFHFADVSIHKKNKNSNQQKSRPSIRKRIQFRLLPSTAAHWKSADVITVAARNTTRGWIVQKLEKNAAFAAKLATLRPSGTRRRKRSRVMCAQSACTPLRLAQSQLLNWLTSPIHRKFLHRLLPRFSSYRIQGLNSTPSHAKHFAQPSKVSNLFQPLLQRHQQDPRSWMMVHSGLRSTGKQTMRDGPSLQKFTFYKTLSRPLSKSSQKKLGMLPDLYPYARMSTLTLSAITDVETDSSPVSSLLFRHLHSRPMPKPMTVVTLEPGITGERKVQPISRTLWPIFGSFLTACATLWKARLAILNWKQISGSRPVAISLMQKLKDELELRRGVKKVRRDPDHRGFPFFKQQHHLPVFWITHPVPGCSHYPKKHAVRNCDRRTQGIPSSSIRRRIICSHDVLDAVLKIPIRSTPHGHHSRRWRLWHTSFWRVPRHSKHTSSRRGHPDLFSNLWGTHGDGPSKVHPYEGAQHLSQSSQSWFCQVICSVRRIHCRRGMLRTGSYYQSEFAIPDASEHYWFQNLFRSLPATKEFFYRHL